MCLILAAWRAVEGFPLIVAANRDEFHGRPAAPAGFWEDAPQILGGRDLEAKGTWMGVARSGRFAAVTNYRGPREPSAAHSRGALVTGFLAGSEPGGAYAARVEKHEYSGFNLLTYDGAELWWSSNRNGAPQRLDPGIYGLGNLLLDSPEVEPAKARFREAISAAPAVEVLFEVLAAARIRDAVYGTRCSTVLLSSEERLRYAERTFSPEGEAGETLHFEFTPAS